MAQTTFGTSDPLTRKTWAKLLMEEAYRRTFLGKFKGQDEDALFMELVNLKKEAGDQITFGLNVQGVGDGVLGDTTLEGNEEAAQFYDDAIVVNQLRHAFRDNGKMTRQRQPYDLRKHFKGRLADWFAQRMDLALANQLCGNTRATDLRYTGSNATVAPSTNRHIFGGTSNAADEDLASSDTITLADIHRARVLAETASTGDNTGPLVRPIMVDGDPHYVMFLHDYQVYDLWQTTAAAGSWIDIQKAAMSGGDVRNNPIFTGALGVYNGVVLHKWSRITTGTNSSTAAEISTVRRAVLCGAQAATIAFGGDEGMEGETPLSWTEEVFDYGNQIGCAAGAIYGIKKTKFVPKDDSTTNAEDFGTVVLSTYAANPN